MHWKLKKWCFPQDCMHQMILNKEIKLLTIDIPAIILILLISQLQSVYKFTKVQFNSFKAQVRPLGHQTQLICIYDIYLLAARAAL